MFVVVYFRKDWSIMEVVSLIQKIKPVFMPLTVVVAVRDFIPAIILNLAGGFFYWTLSPENWSVSRSPKS